MVHPPLTLRPAEYYRAVYPHTPAEGNDFEAILKPAYWAHVARILKEGDKLEITAHDGSYYADLLVMSVQSHAVAVAVLFKTELRAPTVDAADEEYDIKLRGPRKWSIVRKADKQVIKEDLPTQDDARRELADYKKALAA